MCILFVRTNPDPKEGEFRLIIASNRDEFYKRPAKEAYLCSNTNIIGGRDLEQNRENGMWLGLRIKPENQTICFSGLLNVTGEEVNSGVESRGFIVPDYLKSAQSSIEFFENYTKNKKFNAFNLINVELNQTGTCTYFLSKNPDQICKFMGEQTLGFGNSPVNRPLGKVRNGRFEFEEVIINSKTKDELKNRLIKFLKSSEKHLPDTELEKRAPENFKHLASRYVEIENTYGTRTHTVILVDSDWKIEFYEETMDSPINCDNIVWKKNLIKSCL